MKEYDQEYRALIESDMDANRTSAREIRKYLAEHNVIYHGKPIHTLQIPKIYTPEVIRDFRSIVNITYRIFEKVIRHYLDDPSYRKHFPFSKDLEELILTPRGYKSLLPIARFDIFYNEETGAFQFCEINTDGTSAMNEDREMNNALSLNPAHRAFLKRHPAAPFELMDSWVKAFLEIYDTYDRKVTHPHVAIVDFLDSVEIEEFYEFARRFEAAGITCEVVEITELRYENGHLLSPSGRTIDAVYRRVVTTDVMSHKDEIRPFIQAVKNRDVCIIGAFCTQVVHNKWLFRILHEDETKHFLTPEESSFIDEHVPFTALLKSDVPQEVLAEKDRWIIKPLDSYGSQGVFAGKDFSAGEWAAHVRACAGADYIYQQYCTPYRTENIDFLDENPSFRYYANMPGLYVYNGQFAGVYLRMADGNVISSQYNERPDAVLVLREPLIQ